MENKKIWTFIKDRLVYGLAFAMIFFLALVSCKSSKFLAIQITPVNSSIYVGGTQQYTAIAIYSGGLVKTVTSSVTWHSSDPRVAAIESAHHIINHTPMPGLAIGLSLGSTIITATFAGHTSNEAILTVAPQFVYVANEATNPGVVTKCNVDIVTGNFYNCVDSTMGSGLTGPAALAMHRFDNNSFMYVTNNMSSFGTMVFQCLIQNSTGLLSCMDTGFTFESPAGIALFTAMNDQNQRSVYAYIVNNSLGTVSKCTIDSITGNFISCVDSGAGVIGTPAIPMGSGGNLGFITFNMSGEKTFAYISAGILHDPNIIKCSIDSFGSFSDCDTQIVGNPGDGSLGIAFTTINNVNYGYITQGSSNFGGSGNSVSRCQVDSTDGSLFDCVNANGSGFNGPWGIAFSTTNGKVFAYITNPNFSGMAVGHVQKCEIDPVTADLINCADSGAGTAPFFAPIGIAFY